MVLEGGSIDVNGAGKLLTTEECLLSPRAGAQSGQLTRADLERALREYLGAREVIWLRSGIAGDDTHGHVDDLARFVAGYGGAVVGDAIRPTQTTSRCARIWRMLARRRI